MILDSFLLSIASTALTEIITWVNLHWLQKTLLKGNAALLLALIVSIVLSAFETFSSGISITNWQSIFTIFGIIFAGSQGWFNTVMTWFNKLQVQIQSNQATQVN